MLGTMEKISREIKKESAALQSLHQMATNHSISLVCMCIYTMFFESTSTSRSCVRSTRFSSHSPPATMSLAQSSS